MDIRELRYFAAVFTERNLTAAAKTLFISQPSISTAITISKPSSAPRCSSATRRASRRRLGRAIPHVARRIIDEADAARDLFRKSSAAVLA